MDRLRRMLYTGTIIRERMRRYMAVSPSGRKVNIPWIVVILLLIVFLPAGLAVLYKKITTDPSCTGGCILLTVLGAACLVTGPLLIANAMADWSSLVFSQQAFLAATALLFMVMGLLCMIYGIRQLKRIQDFKRLSPYLLGHVTTSMESLAERLDMPYHVVSRKLQKLIDCGYLNNAYLNHTHRWFVFGKAWLPAPPPPEEEEQQPSQPEDSESAYFLSRIRQINESLPQSPLTNKIYQIEGLTAKIFQVIEQKPEKRPQIRSFMNYYLPATLKLLDTYSGLQRQKVRGENIDAAFLKVETAVDTLVDAFKKQLDLLFADEVMDIATDIKVIEGMLAKDGLVGPFNEKKTP